MLCKLTDSEPAALNALRKLSESLIIDADYATTVQNELASKANARYVNIPSNTLLNSQPWAQI
jgi:hypothetical protein